MDGRTARLVALGEPAARVFLGPGVRLSEVWGKPQSWRGVPLLSLLHPSPRNRRALKEAGLNPEGYRKFLARLFRRFLGGGPGIGLSRPTKGRAQLPPTAPSC